MAAGGVCAEPALAAGRGDNSRKKKQRLTSDRVHLWLADYCSAEGGVYPDRVKLDDEELAKKIFMILETVEYRWTITEILEQPEDMLNQVLLLKALKYQVKEETKKDGRR